MWGGDPDGQIYQAFCAGDAEAIPALIRRYSASLLRFIHDPRRARFQTWVFFQARGAGVGGGWWAR
jgi:hypothetical protein